MGTLSELLERKSSIEDMLIESGGEITPEIDEALGLNEENIRGKIDGYHSLIVKMDYGNAEIDKEIKRLQTLKKTKENAKKRLKEHLLFKMSEFDIDEIDGNTCKAFRALTAPSVVVDDEDALLAPYAHILESYRERHGIAPWVKMTVSIDKTILKDTLKTEGVEGCSLERGECVKFR